MAKRWKDFFISALVEVFETPST
ncbi:uncharacterized protein METZ01_LOCUS211565 [marine metagenome]|uniref:Uncharacterized protein n=1 Tax=marine metagenome TaxID=408172 RepID=A0A382F9E5_9ZZZZ